MMPQFLRASCFALPLYREKTQHKRDIKIFYHYQEGFSINFHIFIHKNYAHPISLRQRMRSFAKGSSRTNVRAKLPLRVSYAVFCRDKNFYKKSVLHQRYFRMVGTRTFILIGFATWSFIPASSAACLSSEKAFAVIAMMGMPAFWGSSIRRIFVAAS